MSDTDVLEFKAARVWLFLHLGLVAGWLAIGVGHLLEGESVPLGFFSLAIAAGFGLQALLFLVRRPFVEITQRSLAYRPGPLYRLRLVPLSSILTLKPKRRLSIELVLAGGERQRLWLAWFKPRDQQAILVALSRCVGEERPGSPNKPVQPDGEAAADRLER